VGEGEILDVLNYSHDNQRSMCLNTHQRRTQHSGLL